MNQRSPMKKRKKKRRRHKTPDKDEAAYVCPTCGEQIVIPLDPTGGAEQEYVEDCPVCCNPNVIRLELFGPEEPARVWAEAE
ncbi:MAG: CPXCG motif-containing cysteine-rich protein [Tepidisphaeraceae bacterium]